MTYIKTIYLGCESTDRADLNNHIVRFDIATLRAHPTIMSHFNPILWKAQVLSELGVLTTPYKICVLFPEKYLDFKFKPENVTNAFESVEWFIRNFHPPKCGVIFSIYSYDDKYDQEIQERWSTQVLWPLDKKWQADRSGSYITLHDREPKIAGGRKDLEIKNHPQYKIIENIEKYSLLPVKRISYAMGEEEIFNTLKHSQMHFSYHGGTLYSAGMIGLPTVCFCEPRMSRISEWWDKGKHYKESVQITNWNNGDNNPHTKVCQYDFDREAAVCRPQPYCYHTETPEELKSLLMGTHDLKIMDRIYELSE